MWRTKRRGLGAILLTLMMALPAFSALSADERASPDIIVHVTTLSSGEQSETVEFQYGTTDDSLALRLPNGATVISATLKASAVLNTEPTL